MIASIGSLIAVLMLLLVVPVSETPVTITHISWVCDEAFSHSNMQCVPQYSPATKGITLQCTPHRHVTETRRSRGVDSSITCPSISDPPDVDRSQRIYGDITFHSSGAQSYTARYGSGIQARHIGESCTAEFNAYGEFLYANCD